MAEGVRGVSNPVLASMLLIGAVTPEDSTQDAVLDDFLVAGHNLAVQHWYSDLRTNWNRPTDECNEKGSPKRPRLSHIDRAIDWHNIPPASYLFRRADRDSPDE